MTWTAPAVRTASWTSRRSSNPPRHPETLLLRRLKVDVERNLPPKKEYLLYAPLTQQHKDIYQAILSRSIRQYLIDKKGGKENDEEESPAAPVEDEHGRSMRKKDGSRTK